MADCVLAAVTLALAYGLFDLIWRNRSLARLLYAGIGAAISCIFIFDQWLAGLILGVNWTTKTSDLPFHLGQKTPG